MSWKVQEWARKQKVGTRGVAAKSLLLVLAGYANDKTRRAWPLQSRLAQDCEVDTRTIRRAMTVLIEGGYVTLLQRGARHSQSTYQLNVPWIDNPTSIPDTVSGLNSILTGHGVRIEKVLNRTSTTVKPDMVSAPLIGKKRQGTVTKKEEGKESANETPALHPRWVEILSAHPKANGKFFDVAWIANIERDYADVDLTGEAHRCLAWLVETPKGQKRTSISRTWVNWITNHREYKTSSTRPTVAAPTTGGWRTLFQTTSQEIKHG